MSKSKSPAKSNPQKVVQPEQPERSALSFPNNISRSTSAIILIIAFSLAFLIGHFAFQHLSHIENKLYRTFLSHIIMGTSLFPLTFAFQNVNLFDPLWFVGTMGISYYWFFDSGVRNYPAILSLIVVTLYSIKHFYSYFGPWSGLGQTEFRTVETKQNMKGPLGFVMYWIGFCLIGYHWFQTFTAFNGIAPLYFVFYKQENVNHAVVILGFCIGMLGVIIEHVSDEQLKQWRAKNIKGCIDTGLWRYSRHPNYFGECTYWFGYWVMGMGCSSEAAWTVAGSIIIWSIFNFITIAWMERHIQHKKGYAEYQAVVSRFLFWPRSEAKTKKN